MTRSSFCVVLLGCLVLALVGSVPQAAGQNLTWSGSATVYWNTSDLNWNAGGIVGSPTTYTNGSALTFDDSAVPGMTSIIINSGTVTPASLVFNNNSLAYSFSAAAIGGAATVTLNGTAGVVFYNANTYTGGTTINSAELLQLASGASLGSGSLTVSAGTVDLGGNNQAVTNLTGAAGTITSSGTGAVTFTVSPSAPSAYGGLLQNGAGTLSLAKNGPSLLALSGINTYSGGTVLSGGTLDVTNAASLGASSGAVTIGPATLEVSGAFASARNISLSSSAAAISVDATQSYTNSGIVSGNGGLSLTGQGLVTLSGINTYTGGTKITAGTLQVGDGAISSGSLGSGAVAIGANTALLFNGAPGGSVTVGGVISGSGSLTESGGGTVVLGNGANTFTGNLLVTSGTLNAAAGTGGASSLGNINAARTITVGSNGEIYLNGGNVLGYNNSAMAANWSSTARSSPPATTPCRHR